MNIAIIFAGGRGERLSADSIPKQFIDIDEKPLIIHTLMNFQNHEEIDKIYIAILPEYYKHMENLVKSYGIDKVKGIVNGGDSAQESIFNALTWSLIDNSGGRRATRCTSLLSTSHSSDERSRV